MRLKSCGPSRIITGWGIISGGRSCAISGGRCPIDGQEEPVNGGGAAVTVAI